MGCIMGVFMLTNNVLPGILCFGAGIFMILARFQRWKWFMNHYKIRDIDDTLGERGADVLYLLTGLAFMVLGVLLIMNFT